MRCYNYLLIHQPAHVTTALLYNYNILDLLRSLTNLLCIISLSVIIAPTSASSEPGTGALRRYHSISNATVS